MADVCGETANPTPQGEVVPRRIRLPDRHGRELSEFELENGKKEPCRTRIHRIAKGFGLSISELLRDV